MQYKNIAKTLLILDLDETLLHASQKKLNRPADSHFFDYHIYLRPHLMDFLKAVNDDFILAIWSSASDDYVNTLVDKFIRPIVPLAFVWGRSQCTYRRIVQIDEYGYYDSDFNNHYNYIKPLKKLKRKGYTLDRILIVDDTPHKSMDNYGNAIYPKEFLGDSTDTELLLLAKYLKTLKDYPTVRAIEKRNWRAKALHIKTSNK